MMDNISGIYIVENITNGHCYIGSSVDIPKRLLRHRLQLRKDIHHSIYLQRAWNKYGENSFTFKPIMFCEPKNNLLYEQMCIDGLKPEYNVCLSSTRPMLYRKHSDETKRKMSRNRKGKSHGLGRIMSDETRNKMSKSHIGLAKGDKNPMFGKPGNPSQLHTISVLQYTKDKLFISHFHSLYEAERETKVFAESISRCIKNNQHTAGGFIWRYANNNQSIQNQNIGDTK